MQEPTSSDEAASDDESDGEVDELASDDESDDEVDELASDDEEEDEGAARGGKRRRTG